MSTDLPPAGTPEWEVLQALLRGDRWFARDETPEPSLLPHLARLCHPFSLGEMWTAADVVGLHSGPFAWPQLFETTANRLAVRFDDATFADQLSWVPSAEIAVRRCLGGNVTTPGIWAMIEGLDDDQRRLGLTARFLLVDPDSTRFERLFRDVDVRFAEAETARAMVTVAANLGRPLDGDWLDAATGGGFFDVGRAAHVLTALIDPDRRTDLADRIAGDVNQSGGPAWWIALVVSRVAPHLSGSVAFDLSRLFDHSGIWEPFISSLTTAGRAIDLDEDVVRAHPFRAELDLIAEPHEVTEGVGGAIIDRHGGSPAMAAPEPPTFALQPPAGPSAAGSDVPRMVDEDRRDDRRLGVDLFVDGQPAPAPLPPAAMVMVQVSIGHGAAHSLPSAIDVTFDPGVERRFLPVRFVNGDTDQIQTLALPADPTASASVVFTVAAATEALTGTIIVYNEDRSAVIQAAALSASVAGSAAAQNELFVQFVQVDAAALSVGSRPDSASVVVNESIVAAAAPSVSISSSAIAVMNQFDLVVTGLQTAASHFVHAGAPIVATLIGAARVGAQLRRQLQLDPLSPFRRIQMVAVDSQTVFPIDLIYDGEEPDTDATLCPNWQRALELGSCETCATLDATAARRVVCPVRFWGLSKVIEHHRTTDNTRFVAHVQAGPQIEHLAAATSVLVGASEIVLKQRREQLGDATASAATALADLVTAAEQVATVTVAEDWNDWQAAIAASPAVLLAMPHNSDLIQGFISQAALELGGALASSITEGFVRAPGEKIGPIVMLLGCNTGVERRVLLSFASAFRMFSPAVVATVGEVIASEAPEIASAILGALAAPQDGAPRTVGEAVRVARCQLMSQSRLVALQLLMHGDADWILTEV